MKKLLGTLAILLLLGIATWFFVGQRENSTFGGSEMAFAIKDSKKVDEIKITDWEGKKRNLKRYKDTEVWTTEDRYVVRQDIIEVVLKTLEDLRVYSPVPANAMPVVKKALEERASRVEIYSKNKLLKTLMITGPVPQGKGNYAQVVGEEEPYIVHIPGFNGYFHRRFFIDIEEWRSREAFNLTPNEIKSVRIEYPAQPEHSFELENNGKTFTVAPLNDENQKTELNGVAAQAYLTGFSDVHIEAYHNDYSKKDSVLQEGPVCKISVLTTEDETKEMIVYPMFINERSKMMFDTKGNPLKYDRDHYYAIMHEGRDLAIIQNYVFGKLFKKYGDFVKGNK